MTVTLLKLREKESKLFNACVRGCDEDVEKLLTEGVEPNLEYDDRGNSILTLSCIYNNYSIAKLLLDYGADINKKNIKGETALSILCRQKLMIKEELEKNYKMINLLLESGADVDSTDANSVTPLMISCFENRNDIILQLLKYGADINHSVVEYNKHETPLMILCKNNNMQMVNEFLKRGANINPICRSKRTPLTYACKNGNAVLAKRLIKHGAKIEPENNKSRCPLIEACKAGSLSIVKELLHKGVDINKKDIDYMTAIDCACLWRKDDIIIELLEYGVDMATASRSSLKYINEMFYDCIPVKIQEAISTKDFNSLDMHLLEYFHKRNIRIIPKRKIDEHMVEYCKFIREYNKATMYLNNLKKCNALLDLRNGIKKLKEDISKLPEDRIVEKEKLKNELKQSKKILNVVRTFEKNMIDIMNIKVLEPIYFCNRGVKNKFDKTI